MNKISACLVVYNEEKIIKRCLESVKDVVDEIIVVHDGPCQDKTLEISRQYTDKIFIRPRIGEAEPHRPFSFSKASHDWILQIDADEFLSAELKRNLKNLVSQEQIDGFSFRWRLYEPNKKKYTFGPREYKPVLLRKQKMYFIGVPHYQLTSRGKIVKSELVLAHLFKQKEFFRKRFKITKNWARLQAKYLTKKFEELESFQASEVDWQRAFFKTKKYSHPLVIPLVFLVKLFMGLAKCRLRFSFALLNSFYLAYLVYYFEQEKQKAKLLIHQN